MLRTFASLLVTSALFAACSTAQDGPATDGAGERGPLGKADAIGTCEPSPGVDLCDGKGTGNCWCDDACVDFGDCCSDAGAVCEIDDAGDDADEGADEGEDGVCGDVVCALFCEHGFETDENGCEVCSCQGQFCGGIAALPCPEGEVCVGEGDFPDAGGHCESIFCGGFAGIQCPEGLTCVDVPGDGCDPPEGADCGGVCIVAEPEPPAPSCEGSCGGQSDDGCWCDDLCTGYGDCCEDFEAVCSEPEGTPCGDETCAAGEICVTQVTQLGPVRACDPIPESCEEGVGSCSCMGEDVCTGAFFLCSDNADGGLSCGCPNC